MDHEESIETCQLCNQEDLRYHFEIKNALTKHALWVGSQCILKFGLSVFENGLQLSPRDAKKKLHRLTDQMRLESCVKALEKLAIMEESDILSNALSYYKKNKYLTPKYAFVVLWRLQTQKIEHSPTFFKVRLNKDKYKIDLKRMKQSQVNVIWPALTGAQRSLAQTLGHSPPLE